jgi:predicted acyltransferase
LYAFATFMFSSVINLFLLMFQIVWIYSMKSFNVVSQILFRRFFICVAKSISWIFANVLILWTMINSNALSIMFNSAMNLCVLKFV